jgi:hypothetical protein
MLKIYVYVVGSIVLMEWYHLRFARGGALPTLVLQRHDQFRKYVLPQQHPPPPTHTHTHTHTYTLLLPSHITSTTKTCFQVTAGVTVTLQPAQK